MPGATDGTVFTTVICLLALQCMEVTVAWPLIAFVNSIVLH